MNVVVLVPRRPDGGHRDRLWEFCRARWERFHPEWRIVEGEHLDGPFNRSAAVNAAARAAGVWDVALIVDADVVPDPRSVEAAARVAAETGRMVVAHDERIMVSRRGTDKVLRGFSGSWRANQMVEKIWYDSVSCAVAVTADLFRDVRGFDERFVGWGREDTAFRIACEAFAGPMLRVAGETFHLWHPVSEGVAQNSPTRQANEKRHQAYVGARWDREKVLALLDEALDLPETTIPRILHRTVPAETSQEVERWWSRFGELHPGWELRTYREPIDPADWPLTGDLFARCQNGAQKAGLIRLECLVRDGGVYVDSDVEPFRSFEPLLRCEAFAAWEDETTVPDAVLGAKPDHPAFVEMIAKARSCVEGGGDAWNSGPGVTTATLPNRPDVLVMPPGSFYPFHYLEKAKRAATSAAPPPFAFCAHQWHHSWGTPEQKRSIDRRQRA